MLHSRTWRIIGSILMLHEAVSLPAYGPGMSFSSPPALVAAFLFLLVLALYLWGRYPLAGGGPPMPEQVLASLLDGVQAACCVTVSSCYWNSYCVAWSLHSSTMPL